MGLVRMSPNSWFKNKKRNNIDGIKLKQLDDGFVCNTAFHFKRRYLMDWSHMDMGVLISCLDYHSDGTH